jgi:predicted HD phosphohydrolase
VPDAERLAIEAHPWFADALRLRRWDDAAKRPQARVPPLRAYHTLLERYFGPQSQPLGPGLDC